MIVEKLWDICHVECVAFPLDLLCKYFKANTFLALNRNLGEIQLLAYGLISPVHPQRTVTVEGREETRVESLAGL